MPILDEEESEDPGVSYTIVPSGEEEPNRTVFALKACLFVSWIVFAFVSVIYVTITVTWIWKSDYNITLYAVTGVLGCMFVATIIIFVIYSYIKTDSVGCK